ncbi:MAG: PEGA domain-containing protein [Acidobacteria bacterium]|nr:PEGA domain-containing protein [Acidobacteriota bacterium]
MRLLKIAFGSLIVFGLALNAADDGFIKARGRPTGAGLFVDGKYIGPAGRFTVPEKYSVPAGEHEVALKDPRYEDFSTKVTVRTGKTTKIGYKLKKAELPKGPFGRLRFGGDGSESFISVTAGDTGAVYINDKFWGFVDELNNAGGGMLLPPGEYHVRAETQNFGVVDQTVKIEAHKVTVIQLHKR